MKDPKKKLITIKTRNAVNIKNRMKKTANLNPLVNIDAIGHVTGQCLDQVQYATTALQQGRL